MRRDINELKEAVASTNSALERTNVMLNRTMISVAQIVGSMADLRLFLSENMATKKDISDLNSRMDGFSGLLLDFRHRWSVPTRKRSPTTTGV